MLSDDSQSYRIKELLQAFDDNGWNRSAALLAHMDTKALTAKEILLAVLKDDPGLLLELRHLLVRNPALVKWSSIFTQRIRSWFARNYCADDGLTWKYYLLTLFIQPLELSAQ